MGVLFLSPIQARAGDGGNAMANLALMKVALLTAAGAASVAKGASLIAAKQYPPGFAWLAGGIAELAGAAMAGGNNAQTEAETRTDERNFPDAGKGINESLTGGLSGGLPPGVSMASICKGASGTCTCNGTNCSNPQITIPSLTDVKGTLTDSYNSDPKSFPEGFSLEEALAKLDNEYGQAEQAVNSFNTASNSGAFDSSLADSGKLQGVKDPNDLTSGKDRPFIGSSGADKAGSGDAVAATTNKLALSDKFANKNSFGNRAPLSRVNRHGLTLEDARTGRLLSIFERVSRAIRADRDRDVTLAKIEYARKELIKKNALKNKTVATTHTIVNIDPK